MSMHKSRNYEGSMETAWRQHGNGMDSYTFYGDFMVKVMWRFFGKSALVI